MDTLSTQRTLKTTVNLTPGVKLGIDALIDQGIVRNQSQFIPAAIEESLKRHQREARFQKMRTELQAIRRFRADISVAAASDELRSSA